MGSFTAPPSQNPLYGTPTPRMVPPAKDSTPAPHPCGQTNTSENITFPQLGLRAVITEIKLCCKEKCLTLGAFSKIQSPKYSISCPEVTISIIPGNLIFSFNNKTFIIAKRGHGPFSFCVIIATVFPLNLIHFTR